MKSYRFHYPSFFLCPDERDQTGSCTPALLGAPITSACPLSGCEGSEHYTTLHNYQTIRNAFPFSLSSQALLKQAGGIAMCFFTQTLVPTLVLGTGKPGSSPALQNPVGAGGWKWSYHLLLKERRFCLALESCLTLVSGAGGLLAAALLPPVARWKEQACWPACSPAEITSSFPSQFDVRACEVSCRFPHLPFPHTPMSLRKTMGG